MSSRFKSRIPERVRNSLTVLDGPNSRISRIRDAALPNRSSLSRSHMPLPISNTLSALVKPVSPKAVFKKTLTEEEAVIRSLVRRSKPLAVRGNRTSFRRIQLAHAAPIGDSSVLLKATDSFCSADFRLQKPIKEAIPADPEKDPAASRTAKSLLDLVTGRRQPGMEQMRFLCSDHRLINVPSPLMYRHSRIMSYLEMEVQPIPLRSIRSVTLLRVIMWMHKKTLCANGTENVAEASPTVEMCIGNIRKGNGNASSETSCQISEITQGNAQRTVNLTSQILGEKIENDCSEICKNIELYNDNTPIRSEDTENSCENNSEDEGDSEECFEKNMQNQENVMEDMKRNVNKQNENQKNDSCTIINETNGQLVVYNPNIQFISNNESTNKSSTDCAKDTINEFTKVNGNRQVGFVIAKRITDIDKDNITEIKTGEDELIIEREICCSRSADNIVIHANVMQNFCKRCGIIRCAGDNANDDQCVADLNEMKRSSYLLCSWEERLLGNELYQLVEIILASHYLGIESLTMNAIHHFCELMAQRTRSESCLMLRIKTRLAGDNHCPLIRESLSLGCHRNNQADGSEIEEQQFEPNSRIARIFRKHRPNGRPAIGGGMGDGLYAKKPCSRNH
ncbi:uncharacterized protein LOC117148316 [Drosophila mauritiana]|uniref:Uncharacterized protein LOC117148316 n=1 Tax=Drosophila mauritiana TaxID=7226 RepID=A0A6P8KZH0_DROMA|nr:uncharacterized protein LOC117148316 [Drosophila mauritiana]